MAENAAVEMKPTLGLTGLTMNAMALIAPGAFLWLTFYIQATTGVTSRCLEFGMGKSHFGPRAATLPALICFKAL